MATVRQQTPPTCKTVTTGRHGDPFPVKGEDTHTVEITATFLMEQKRKWSPEGTKFTDLVLVSVDRGVTNRPSETCHRPRLSTRQSRVSERSHQRASPKRTTSYCPHLSVIYFLFVSNSVQRVTLRPHSPDPHAWRGRAAAGRRGGGSINTSPW